MIIGILKEKQGESRVALLPKGVGILVKLKASILVETKAGQGAYVTDDEYISTGAKVDSREEVIKQSDILLMINLIDAEEISKLRENQIIIGQLNPFFNISNMVSLANSGISSFSMDIIPRTSLAQSMDVLSSMATISGYKAVLDAANLLPNFFPMFMTAAGTIRPAKVLILGAGVAGLQAIATSRRLGAVVESFDVRSAARNDVESLGGKFVEVEGSKEDVSAGGYAVEQTEEYKNKQKQLIQDHAVASNVIICTAQIPGRIAPLLITKETVEAMKPGSVIIDLAASTGGNCEVTKNEEIVVHNNVKVVGNSNYPCDMPSDASKMFGENLVNFLKLFIDKEGALKLDFENELIKGTCITHNKEIVNEKLKQKL
jgi:NAD(P) transhydrogenase subunit alpha